MNTYRKCSEMWPRCSSNVSCRDFSSVRRTHGHRGRFGRLQQHLSVGTDDRLPAEADTCAWHRAPKHAGDGMLHQPRVGNQSGDKAADTTFCLDVVTDGSLCFHHARSASFSMQFIPRLNSDWTSIKPKMRWLLQRPELHRCTVTLPTPSRRSDLPGWCCRMCLFVWLLWFLLSHNL